MNKRNTETGAPAVLRRLEKDALELEQTIDNAKERLVALQLLSPNGEKADEKHKAEIARVQNEYDSARDEYIKVAKVLLPYDKGISSERKEGEKISVAEAREIFAQLVLSIDLSIEQVIISDAQSAALCDSPESFHAAHAENYRAAKAGALDAATRDGVLPKWIA